LSASEKTGATAPSPRLRGEGRGEGRGDWPPRRVAKPLILTFPLHAGRRDSAPFEPIADRAERAPQGIRKDACLSTGYKAGLQGFEAGCGEGAPVVSLLRAAWSLLGAIYSLFRAKNLPAIFTNIYCPVEFFGRKPRQNYAIAIAFGWLSGKSSQLERPAEPARPQSARP
jgi:hypothetical protein